MSDDVQKTAANSADIRALLNCYCILASSWGNSSGLQREQNGRAISHFASVPCNQNTPSKYSTSDRQSAHSILGTVLCAFYKVAY